MTIAKDSTAKIAPGLPFGQRVLMEGLPYSTGFSWAGTAANGTSGLGTLMLPGLTRALWVESLIISANKNIRLQVSFSATTLGAGYPDYFEVIIAPGMPAVVPVHQLLRPSQYPSNGGAGGATIRTLFDADGTNAQIAVYAIGQSITDDLYYAADKVILHLGDSITAGGTGITAKYNQYDWRILNYHRDAGKSVRMINLAMSGTTSGNFETRRLQGELAMPQVDHINYSLGANDAAQGVSPSTFQTNLANMIVWKQSHYPNATMHVFGCTPQENNTNEANAVNIRAAAQAAVTSASDPNVKYLNLGGAFDRTVVSNYASTDPTGTHIHPSDAGHLAIWNVIKPFLDANPVLV